MTSNTIDGTRATVHAMEKSGKFYQIGHHRRSNPRYRYTLDKLIKEHKICGQIVNINSQLNRAVSSSQDTTFNPKLTIDPAILNKYGFAAVNPFMNWRTFRSLSGGAISDLGAHHIYIFGWFFGILPKSVYASGGSDYFTKCEHFDNMICIFEYDTPQGAARTLYQVLTTTTLFPRLRSDHQLFQRPSPKKQIPDIFLAFICAVGEAHCDARLMIFAMTPRGGDNLVLSADLFE